MKTKEAIGLIRLLRDVLYDAYSIGKTYVGGTEGFEKNIDDIISLLQQGEKYKQMCSDIYSTVKDNKCFKNIVTKEFQKYLDTLKEVHFPKEAKDYPEGEE